VTLLLAGIAALALLELAVTVLLRPQSGPLALAAIFEPHLLALGAVCGLLAILATLSDREPRASRIRLLGVAALVVALVRVGGEWWSPDEGPDRVLATSGAARMSVMTWNLEAGSRPAVETVEGVLDAPGRAQPDIVLLQELTHDVATSFEASDDIDAVYPYRYLEPRDGVRGMGILSSLPILEGTYEAFPMLLTATVLLSDGARVELLDVHPFPPVIDSVRRLPRGLDTR